MNEQASEMGSRMQAGGYRETLAIDHREPAIRIDYAVEFEGRRTRAVYDLTTDGAEKRTETPLGEEVTKTSWKDGRLVTDSRLGPGGQESRTTRYLSADGKRLYVAYGKSPAPKWLVFDRDPSWTRGKGTKQ